MTPVECLQLAMETYRSEVSYHDEAIFHHLAMRRQFSVRTQQCKIAQGLPLIDLAQERLVIARYEEGLGRGPEARCVAGAVLRYCRGQV